MPLSRTLFNVMPIVTVVHTKCLEDLPSWRTGIWKDFTEAVSLYPDLDLAKGLGKKRKNIHHRSPRGRIRMQGGCPCDVRVEREWLMWYNSVRVEKKMSERRREKRFTRKPAERKDDLCGPWTLGLLDKLALETRNPNQFLSASQGCWCSSYPVLLITNSMCVRTTVKCFRSKDRMTLGLSFESNQNMLLLCCPAWRNSQNETMILLFIGEKKQSSSHRAEVSQIAKSEVSFLLS